MGINYNPNMLNDPLGGIAMEYGVPSCMVDLAKNVLSLLPGDVLGGVSRGIAEGENAARNAMASIFEDIHDAIGILEYDSQTGKLSLFGDSSRHGADSTLGDSLGELGELIGFVAGAAGAIYQAGQDIMDQIEAIENCLQDFHDWMDRSENKGKFQDANTAQQQIAGSIGQFNIYKSQASAAKDFLDRAAITQGAIAEIFAERVQNPDLIPVFTEGDPPVAPEQPIFRLDFGPPKAKRGQYLLSVDGLYYDSQERDYAGGSEVPTTDDLEFVPAQDRWMLDHTPNLGGRGTSYSIKQLNSYVDTLFDLDVIDDSTSLQNYYDADHFLQVLKTHRNQAVDFVNKNIVTILNSGYKKDSAIYVNYVQQLKSENSLFLNKINKRKKQIEVAVKAPDLFGSSDVFSVGNVPINDFSYLSSINLDVEMDKQRNLVFDHGEVSGVVLPIKPLFARSDGSMQKVVLTPLEVAEQGVASLLDGEEVSETPYVLSLVSNITTDNLIAVYNFADVNIQVPDSTTYNTLNCTAKGTENRAQTVSTNPNYLFQKGLAIPYLTGVTRLTKENAYYEFDGEDYDTYPYLVGDAGNYVKLPDTQDYQNLFYNNLGCSIDVWTYIPGLFQEEGGWWEHPFSTSAWDFNFSSTEGKWCDAHYYRVLLGCENTGGTMTPVNQSQVFVDRSSETVRGMLMGFSREPRMYYDGSAVLPGSTDLNPREFFGWSLSGVVGPNTFNYDKGSAGVWVVSGDSINAIPAAVRQASGTFQISDDSDKTIEYTITEAGDGYPASSHDACCILWTSGERSPFGGSIAFPPVVHSGTLGISYFDTVLKNRKLEIGAGSSVFFIAPTQSYISPRGSNDISSTVGFVRNSLCPVDDEPIMRFMVSTKEIVEGVALSSISTNFVNLQITFDVENDLITLYVNGVKFKTQSISSTFGTNPKEAPQVPSFMIPKTYSTSSFYYSKSTVNQTSSTSLFDNGPDNYGFFTPWIVGGGWTDGRPVNLATSSGGFLDPGAGMISSYNGYVGSLKFYRKPLNKTEVITNYNAQRVFFENIDV